MGRLDWRRAESVGGSFPFGWNQQTGPSWIMRCRWAADYLRWSHVISINLYSFISSRENVINSSNSIKVGKKRWRDPRVTRRWIVHQRHLQTIISTWKLLFLTRKKNDVIKLILISLRRCLCQLMSAIFFLFQRRHLQVVERTDWTARRWGPGHVDKLPL